MSDISDTLARFAREFVRCLEDRERGTRLARELAARENLVWGENTDGLIAALRAGDEPLWVRVLAWFRMPQFRFVANPEGGESSDLFVRLLMASPFRVRSTEYLEHALANAQLEILFKHMFDGE